RPTRRLPAHAVTVVVPAMEDLQQGAPGELGVVVGLDEPAGPHASTEPGPTRVLHGLDDGLPDGTVLRLRVAAAAREQPQEVGLPRTIRPQDRDALSVPDLQVEGAHETGQLQPLADDGPLAGTGTTQ